MTPLELFLHGQATQRQDLNLTWPSRQSRHQADISPKQPRPSMLEHKALQAPVLDAFSGSNLISSRGSMPSSLLIGIGSTLNASLPCALLPHSRYVSCREGHSLNKVLTCTGQQESLCQHRDQQISYSLLKSSTTGPSQEPRLLPEEW